MTEPVIIWQSGPNSAVDDVKELPRGIRMDLFRLSREVLVEKPDSGLAEDEQSFPSGPFMMRRAARREDMRALDSLPDGDPRTPPTVRYWFVYRKLNALEAAEHGGRGFFVARVVDDLQLAWMLQRAQTTR